MYRQQLKTKEEIQVSELEELEQKNARLTMKEQQMRENLANAKKVYLDLILNGRVRFCN